MPASNEDLYTLRWHVTQGDQENLAAALVLLGRLLGEQPPKQAVGKPGSPKAPQNRPGEPERLLWCPFAVTKGFPAARTKGKYPKGYPEGAIVHFTAGHPEETLANGLAFQAREGYTYFLIDQDGNIGQNFPLNEWGQHAGESYWNGLGKSVSNRVVGIEITCAGVLDKNNAPWFAPRVPFPDARVRTVVAKDNVQAGNYQKYTPAQEHALMRLLAWLRKNDPTTFKVEYVLGHDEVSGKRGLGYNRKPDPGGSLSLTMDELRARLAAAT